MLNGALTAITNNTKITEIMRKYLVQKYMVWREASLSLQVGITEKIAKLTLCINTDNQ